MKYIYIYIYSYILQKNKTLFPAGNPKNNWKIDKIGNFNDVLTAISSQIAKSYPLRTQRNTQRMLQPAKSAKSVNQHTPATPRQPPRHLQSRDPGNYQPGNQSTSLPTRQPAYQPGNQSTSLPAYHEATSLPTSLPDQCTK